METKDLSTQQNLPAMLLTGDLNFAGRHFAETYANHFRMICIANQSQVSTGISDHPNLHWIKANLTKINVEELAQCLKIRGGIDFVMEISDENSNSSEGTKKILELSKQLSIKRYIYSSPMDKSNFSAKKKTIINEQNLKLTEDISDLILNYSYYFPCSVVQHDSLFSDWCENRTLYKFLQSCLADKRNGFALRNKYLIPSIHVNDFTSMLYQVIEKNNQLPHFTTFLASSSRSATHRDLFEIISVFNSGIKASNISKTRTGHIENKFVIDNSDTRKLLNWAPTRRYDILRRIPFLIEKMKNNPDEWKLRNEKNYKNLNHAAKIDVHEILSGLTETLTKKTVSHIMLPENYTRFHFFRDIDLLTTECKISSIYQMITLSIKTKDSRLLQDFMNSLTQEYFNGEYSANDMRVLCNAVSAVFNEVILSIQDLKNQKPEIITYANLLLQFIADETEDFYEILLEDETSVHNNSINIELKQSLTEYPVYNENNDFKELLTNGMKTSDIYLN